MTTQQVDQWMGLKLECVLKLLKSSAQGSPTPFYAQTRKRLMDDIEIINICNSIQRKCWELFIYVHDNKQYMVEEHWKSHADLVEQGKRFRDDCDGYALTCAELLIKAGVPRDRVIAVYCVTETGEAHLVCGVNTETTTYILENRYENVYDWKARPRYQWILFMNFNEPGTWRKVVNARSGNH